MCDGAKPALPRSASWEPAEVQRSIPVYLHYGFLLNDRTTSVSAGSCEGLYSLEHAVNTPFDLHHSLPGSRLYLLHSIKSPSRSQKRLALSWPTKKVGIPSDQALTKLALLLPLEEILLSLVHAGGAEPQ